MPPPVHAQSFRIVMSEVDVAQIHFTTLFRWMDRGLTEWLASAGHPFTRLLTEGPGIPIVDARVSISGRVMLDDVLEIRTWVAAPGRSSFRSRHLFLRDGAAVARGELVHVCVDRDTRATLSVPAWLRERAALDEWSPDTAP